MQEARVLVMGATFKEDVSDIRNSKVVDVINELKSFSCHVEVVDPHADSDELMEEYGFDLVAKTSGIYHSVIVAVNHQEYYFLDENYFVSILSEKGVLVDLKGIFRNKIQKTKLLDTIMDYKKIILITGGAGFIGSHVVRKMINRYLNT